MLHHAELNLPEREGKHYAGTNRGNAITGVKVPCDDELWVTTFAEKLAIFGTSGRTLHGMADRQKRELDDYEPLMFHCWPREIYEEYIHLFLAATVIDMSPGSGTFAEACLRSSTGYVAICWSQLHRQRVEQRLKLFLLKEMMDETSPLYNPKICEHIQRDNVDGNVGLGRSVTAHCQKKWAAKKKAATAAAMRHLKKNDANANLSLSMNGGDAASPAKNMKIANAIGTDNVEEDRQCQSIT